MKPNYLNGLSNFINDIKYFGIDPAFAILFSKIAPYSKQKDNKIGYWLNNNKHRAILRYLKLNYGQVLKLLSSSDIEVSNLNSKRVVWSFWWQGKDKAPELIKMCFKSMEINSNEHELIVLDKDNFEQYVKLPNYIMEKVENGQISLTQFSDIVRAYLLYNYGGAWIDSTMLLVKQIPEELFEVDFFMGKLQRERIVCISEMRWVGSFMAGKKHNLYFRIMLEFFLSYWSKESKLIDYFLIDYIAELILSNNNEAKEFYNKIPINNPMMYKLDLNDEYNEDDLELMTKDTFIFKNQRRNNFVKENLKNNKTYYGYFYDKYLN